MKKFTILLGLILSLSLISQASKLSIKLYDHSLFTIVVDNNHFNTPTKHFTLKSISYGKHYVKIIKHIPEYFGHSEYNIVVYKGFINIPGMSTVYAKLNYHNKLVITKVVKYSSHGSYIYGHSNSYSNYYDSNGYYDESEDIEYNSYYEDYSFGMSTGVFENLKFTILNTSFDSNKLTLAKQAVSVNGTKSKQVYELMTLLNFESNKLELAKFAYAYTVDRSNFFMVNNAFIFDSSINELNEYIYGFEW